MNYILAFKPEMTIPDNGFQLFPLQVLLDLLDQPNVSVQLTKRHTGASLGTNTDMLQYMQFFFLIFEGTITN